MSTAPTQQPYRTFPPVLILDHHGQLPTQFRDSDAAYATAPFSLEGLTELRASGSSQYSLSQLTAVVDRLSDKKPSAIVLVDLRQESHVFLNGEPVSWYAEKDWSNVGRSLEWIDDDERTQLIRLVAARTVMVGTLAKGSAGQVSLKDPVPLEITDATTESGLAHQLGLEYFRIPVTDHCRPTDEMVDRFIGFVRTVEDGAALHFHCHGGDGRTTTFLTLYDMIRNAAHVSLQDLVARQSMLGQYHLFGGGGTGWKAEVEAARTQFIKEFYRYVKDGWYPTTTWTEWLRQQSPATPA